MSTTTGHHEAEQALHRAAAGLYAATPSPAGLAGDVLRRARRSRRRRLRLGGAAALTVTAGVSVAAVVVGGGPYLAYTQPSGAMAPTVGVGGEVVLDRDLVPRRGDVVVLTVDVAGRSTSAMSRVVGLPGEVVDCPALARDPDVCAVRVDGVALTDPYLAGLRTAPFEAARVPTGRLFVLGDARDVANDSRFLGPVRSADVRGVAVAVVSGEGRVRPVPGAPRHAIPDDYEVDPAAPVPPAGADPVP